MARYGSRARLRALGLAAILTLAFATALILHVRADLAKPRPVPTNLTAKTLGQP